MNSLPCLPMDKLFIKGSFHHQLYSNRTIHMSQSVR